jgi:hypothetical protein
MYERCGSRDGLLGNLLLRIAGTSKCEEVTVIYKNSVAFSPQANYTDRATAACR